MAKASPGVFIVAGVDSQNDHLCIAWSERGIEGIGRKIFPVPKGESSWYVCYAGDYNTFRRVIALRSGGFAILCACYDIFGCAEDAGNPTPRTSAICNINSEKTRYGRSSLGRLRQKCINDFRDLLVSYKVTVGLGSIHNFRKPGTDNYWQRHGIQACSAALKGGLAAGAAHFREGLPEVTKSTLAAAGIPERYLSDKPFTERPISMLIPTDGVSKDGLLVRLFEFRDLSPG